MIAIFERPSRSKSTAMPIVREDMPNWTMMSVYCGSWTRCSKGQPYLAHGVCGFAAQEPAVDGWTDDHDPSSAFAVVAVLVEMWEAGLDATWCM